MSDGLTTDAAPPAVAAPAVAPGAVIAGRYRLDARLGAGGGGTVWRCTDDKLGGTVALKILDAGGDLDRWRREVAMARRIAHRNVCRVHDLGDTADLRYVTMELVEGKSLRERMRAGVTAAEARALIEQIVAGAAAIHAAGVVHRDLKPENVVVAPDGRAVIVDFGLAREPRAPAGRTAVALAPTQTNVTDDGVVVGTPRYMSPEQAAGDTVDARTDVWALGLIAHELLAGELPRDRAVAEAVGDAWPTAAAVVRKCLAPATADRFADAHAMQVALAPARRRWPWAVGGVAALAGIAAVIALRRDGEPATEPYRMLQLTTTPARDWPAEAPASVAIAPDATRFAYTTGGAKLYVRDLAGGAPRAWQVPSGAGRARVVALSVAGWFSDGSVAVVASTEDAALVYRVRETGADQIYIRRGRVRAAVGGDRTAVAADGDIELIPGGKLASIAGLPLALAWSPDGSRVAYAHAHGDDAAIDLVAAGAAPRTIWQGRSTALDPLLAWVGDDRLAFSYERDGVTHLAGIDVRTGATDERAQWPAEAVGGGSAARGTVLLVRGLAPWSVQLRSAFRELRRLAAESAVGWTSDGRLVVTTNGKIAIATRGVDKRAPWALAPWPGASAADIAEAVAGDSVIVRHGGRIERLGPAGERRSLGESPGRVHCATTCAIEQAGTWTAFDPTTGELGPVIATDMPRGALSPDGVRAGLHDGHTVGLAKPPAMWPGTVLQSIAASDTGDLWFAGLGIAGRPFGLARSRFRESTYYALYPMSEDALRSFGTPIPHGTDPDFELAVPVRDFHFEIWRADGI